MIKKGKQVEVICGKDKGKKGEVIEILRNVNKAKVKGINMIKKHEKTTKEKKGGIITKENFIDISNLRIGIEQGMVKQDMGTARIAMLQKELRGTIKQLSDEKVLLDKQGLILAGADRALREMLSIFRDDPIEGPLTEASMGVWTKILQEES